MLSPFYSASVGCKLFEMSGRWARPCVLDDWRGSDPIVHSLLLFSEIQRQEEGVLAERLLTNLSKQVGLLGFCEQTATISRLDLTVPGRKCFRGN